MNSCSFAVTPTLEKKEKSQKATARKVVQHWATLARDADILTPIASEERYKKVDALLHSLLDEIGDNEEHVAMPLVKLIGDMIYDYEQDKHPLPEAKPSEILAFLMQQHDLKQTDLRDIAPQSVISELLNNKRDFNKDHIEKLSKRFGVSPAVFF